MTLTFSPVKELLLRVSSLFAGLFLLAPAELTLLPPRLVEEFLLRAPVVGAENIKRVPTNTFQTDV